MLSLSPAAELHPLRQEAVQNTGALINGRFLTRPATGVDRFAYEVTRQLHALPGLLDNIQIALPGWAQVSSEIAADLNGHIQRYGRSSGHLWEQVELPMHVKDRLLLNFCNTGPMFRERQLVVIHDAATMATPDNYGRAFRLWYRTMIGNLMRHSRVVCTVSKFSADELVKYFGRPRGGIEVISESGEHILREAADSRILYRLGLSERRFALAVGSRARNKNLKATIAAMAHPGLADLKLVAVGAANDRVFQNADGLARAPIFSGYVTDPELRALYQNASCFVFPSLYEGFGLPPLEAMICGCPVVVSDRGSLPEVCGGAALYCEPDDPASIAGKIRSLLESEDLRQEMIARGRQHALTFRWKSAAASVSRFAAA